MAIPLTVAIVLLGLLVVMLAVVVLRQSRQIAALTRHHEARTDKMIAYYDHRSRHEQQQLANTTRYFSEQVGNMLASQPDITDKTTRMISDAVSQVAKSVTDGMRAVYAPMQASDRVRGEGEPGDVITPFYGSEGYGDFTDPTDFMDGVNADGNDYSGPVIEDGDPMPFGVPGLMIDDGTLPAPSVPGVE